MPADCGMKTADFRLAHGSWLMAIFPWGLGFGANALVFPQSE